ncbi:hypothetical protein QCA50_017634 [Cerrena zonata]|uniref:Inosine/uridine-preferring nucleoside hydrolase domain-containing protein n=1 Tax=Cerrena zonata TaxID=2478898 RepID=A0AAW0FKG8_9APHY
MKIFFFYLLASALAANSTRKVFIDNDGITPLNVFLPLLANMEILGLSASFGDPSYVDSLGRASDLVHNYTLGSCIPLYGGASTPLIRTEKTFNAWQSLYGEFVWKGAWDPKYNNTHLWDKIVYNSSTPAAWELVKAVKEHPNEVEIYAAGLMTTVAQAISLYPSLPQEAKALWIMGGYIDGQYDQVTGGDIVDDINTDFNLMIDPEAAHIVLTANWTDLYIGELAERGYKVLALDKYQPPSPLSAANDLNKIIRVEYPDKLSARLAVEALELWKQPPYSECFVETGRLTLTPDDPNSNRNIYETKSSQNLEELGVRQRIKKIKSLKEIGDLIPEFKNNTLPDTLNATYNYDCGTGLSDKSIKVAFSEASRLGVAFAFGDDGEVTKVDSHKVTVKSGKVYEASKVIVSAGASTVFLVPLDSQINAWGGFVAHIKLTDEEYEIYKDIPIFFSAEYGYFFPPDAETHRIKIALTTCDAFALKRIDKQDIKVPRFQTEYPDTVPKDHYNDIMKLIELVLPDLAYHKPQDFKTCWCADTSTMDKIEGKLEPQLDEVWRWKVKPEFRQTITNRQPRPNLNLAEVEFFKD